MPGHLEASELVLFYPKVRGLPRTFAWLTGQSCVSKLTVISNPLTSLTFQVNIMVFYPDIMGDKLHLEFGPKFQHLYYYIRNVCDLIGLEQWYFSLI